MALNLDTTIQEHERYLLARGIGRDVREKLGIESCASSRLKDEGFKWPEQWAVKSALLIPANAPNGELIGYGARLFYGSGKTFGEDSRAKYLSLPSEGTTPPSIHFSPLANWDKLEYGQRVFICESYIKANLMCKLGYHAIGVSGCNGWAWKRQLNPQIRDFDWRGRGLQPVIFMDSNVNEERPDLWNAAKRLQAALDSRCGVDAQIILLPPDVDGEHWGLDDFYITHGEAKLRAIVDGEALEMPSELDAHLVQMNSEVCVIRDVGKFADVERNILMGRGQFEDVNYADRKAFNTEGKKVPVAKVWTTWDKRNIVDTIRYKPGKEKIVESINESYFNLWTGWGCRPMDGDSTLFTEWVEDAFSEEQERKWFLDWWAFQLQQPGVKLNTATMLVGPSGVGKGWMAAIAERIFGSDNTWKCNLSDLESRFNSGLGAAQLLVIEEADISGGVKVYNVLKDLITNEHLRWERKGVDAVKLDNCVNIFLNSNHIGVLQLDEFDRRFAVLEITNKSIANDLSYWEPRWDWLRGGGASVIMHYLLERDISGFNPHGEAPWTQAKSDMMEATHDPMETWVRDFVIKGEQISVAGRDVDGHMFTAKELYWCYNDGAIPWNDIKPAMSAKMNRVLTNARARVANHGKKIKYKGVSSRYFLVGSGSEPMDYQGHLASRQFFEEMVASLTGEVAGDLRGGNLESKY